MIAETLSLMDKITLVESGDAIVLLDGDAIEINVIRDGERMAILNLAHFQVDEEGERVPVNPLGIQVTITRAGESREAEKRPAKLKPATPKKTRVRRGRSAAEK